MAQQHQFLHHRRSAATARHLHSQHSSPLAAAGVAARRQQQQRRTTTRDLTTLAAAGTSQPATTPSGAAASTATEQLRAWVHQHGLPSPAELQPVLVDARGHHRMLASAPVQEGSLLLQVPERLMLTANSALASKHCGKLVREAELSEWQALVLHLLCERAAGRDSFWAPYIAVLGDQATHPLLWGPEQQEQLVGSAMLRTLQTRLQQVQEDTDLLVAAGANELPIAQAWEQQHQSPLVDLHSVCWAAAVLLGRSFSLDLSEPELPCEGDMSYFGSWQAHGPASLCLVPWADMCQHSSDAGAEAMLLFDPEARAALLSADRNYAAGDEVFDSHGLGLSWADLVMDHGCVAAVSVSGGGSEESSDNPRYDLVMTDHLQPRGSRNTTLLSALEGLTGNPPIVSLTPHGPDAMGLAVLRAALATDAELIQAGWRTGSTAENVGLCARVMARLGAPKSVGTEGRVLGVLEGAVEACLAAYPSSIEQDEAELVQLVGALSSSTTQQQHGQDGGGEVIEQQQQQHEEVGQQSAAAAAAAPVVVDMQQQVRASILRGLISEKSALVGSREVLLEWQQQLKSLAAGGAGSSSGRAVVKPEQIAAIYELHSSSDDE